MAGLPITTFKLTDPADAFLPGLLNYLKLTPVWRDEVYVGEREPLHYYDNVLKVNTLIFEPNAFIELHYINRGGKYSFLVVMAQKLILLDPRSENVIRRTWVYDPPIPEGRDGEVGKSGTSRYAALPPEERTGYLPPPDDRDGVHGYAGSTGGEGTAGTSRDLVDVYFLFQEIDVQPGTVPPEQLNLTLNFSGIDATKSGKGGRGGDGMNGVTGKDGESGGFGDCKRGAGTGGNGGDAGQGGKGGPSASGGPGAKVTIAGPQAVLNALRYARVLNEGGRESPPGEPGDPGTPGEPGNGGGGSTGCHGEVTERRGHPGKIPQPPNLGPGYDYANKGERGDSHQTLFDITTLY